MAFCLLFLALVAAQDSTFQIYDGKTGTLQNSFQDWSWATHNLKDTTNVRSGSSYDISVVMNNWEALYLEGSLPAEFQQLKTLHFYINGGTNGGEPVVVRIIDSISGNSTGAAVDIATVLGQPIPKNTWVLVEFPFTMFGNVGAQTHISGIWWEANSADNTGTIYLDDINVVWSNAPPPGLATVVDVKTNNHAFNKEIFGVNFASADQIKSNGYTSNRWGGNAVTRYSWDLDVNNHAADWYFENLPNDVANESALPFGSSSDSFIDDTITAGSKLQLTVPTIGWTPTSRDKTCGFSVAKYGAQQSVDPYWTDCGNGVNTAGKDITGNDPHDTSKAADPSYVLNWLSHIETAFGTSVNASTILLLDNEPGLWSSTHRDVHPNALTYDELWSITSTYTKAIKAKSGTQYQTAGPVFWGWCAYMYSPADGCADGPDRQAHGDLPFLEWYTKQVGDYRTANGVELVNTIDVHFYPQANGVYSEAEDPTTAQLRLDSTRSLWDPTYVDESWINQPIYIIPRMQQYIAAHAPGLKSSISEYSFGADDLITQALANAEALVIFARENLNQAARWVAPAAGTFAENAFRLLLNFDGQGGTIIGSNSVSATTTDIDAFGSYAFQNTAKSELYVVLIYKATAGSAISIDVSSAISGTATGSVYQFAQNQPVHSAGTVSFTSGKGSINLPAWSATLVRIPY